MSTNSITPASTALKNTAVGAAKTPSARKNFITSQNPDDYRATQKAVKKNNARLSEKINGRGIQKLGQKEFLKLFVEELKFQDPMNPMKDKDFIAQMATFSTLEQMTAMGKQMEAMGESFKSQSAVNLMGKYVEAIKDNMSIKGAVAKVTFEKGEQYIWVNSRINGRVYQRPVTMKNIVQVREETPAAPVLKGFAEKLKNNVRAGLKAAVQKNTPSTVPVR